MAKQQLSIYSVTQITSLIKVALEEQLPPRVIVTGQVSDWKIHSSSGHCYFSLKDENAVLPCVMWASDFKNVKFRPETGLAVLAKGYIDVYPPQGKYQFYAEKLAPAGVGALQLAFEQMRKRLEAEGLFDEKHKKPLPQYPMRIGIVTSESGAAILDIADGIHNRWPCAKLFLYPVLVQGEGAAEDISQAIIDINRRNRKLKLDVLIVGRGGGSLEDLWAFNEEIVARAIFASEIPLISAVGHEVDFTIADFVADARASTPTKAAVIAVPDIAEVLTGIQNIERRLAQNVKAGLQLARENLQTILASHIFKKPQLVVSNRHQQLDELQSTMTVAVKNLLLSTREKLRRLFEMVLKIEPRRLLSKRAVELNNLQNKNLNAVKNIINKRQLALTADASRLLALNPRSVLNRGYSISTNKKTGLLIKKAADIETGDIMITELAQENLIESQVIKK
jgi:exodeoxyribonuclease VII large subunit